MAASGETEDDVQTDEMIGAELPIMRNRSFRQRLRGSSGRTSGAARIL